MTYAPDKFLAAAKQAFDEALTEADWHDETIVEQAERYAFTTVWDAVTMDQIAALLVETPDLLAVRADWSRMALPSSPTVYQILLAYLRNELERRLHYYAQDRVHHLRIQEQIDAMNAETRREHPEWFTSEEENA